LTAALLSHAAVGCAAAAVAWALGRMRAAAAEAAGRERLAAREREVERLARELAESDAELDRSRDESASRQARAAELEATLAAERRMTAEKDEAQGRLSDAFRALSAEALASNNASFLHLARATLERYQEGARGELEQRRQAIDELVRPLAESLVRVDQKIGDLERTRAEAFGTLAERLQGLAAGQAGLERETAKLVNALRSPAARGRWGEIQLQRVVELAGMLAHCDFTPQMTMEGDDGRLRPDMVVHLPNGRHVVVDAKAPLEAYLEALESTDEETRRARLQDHARQLRAHVQKLAARGYARQLDASPEFVVLFLPGETFFGAALEQDPTLIEHGVAQNVIVATPTTLIALLRAVAYGWRQEEMEKNAREVSRLGRDLHDRLATLAGHLDKLRRGLDQAVESYNGAVGSFEGRVLPAARRFKELGAGGDEEIPTLHPAETATRPVATLEPEALAPHIPEPRPTH
jgi:DNA recombination protein RmuC